MPEASQPRRVARTLGRALAAVAPLLALAAVLGLVTHVASWLLFGVTSYAGERPGWVLVLARQELGTAVGQQLGLLALHVVVYLLLLLLAEGLLRGIETVRGRALAHRWWWRAALAPALNLLVMLQAVATYPALFAEQLQLAGGARRALQELAVGLGPYWLVGLAVPLVGHGIYLGRRHGGRAVAAVVVALAAVVGSGRELLFGHASAPLSPPPRPNLLIVACDSLRFDRAQSPAVPTLSSLGARGVGAELRVSLARTVPAWTSLLGGRWPPVHGIRHMFPPRAEIDRPLPSIFRSFREAGYRTFVVGELGSEQFADMDFGFAERDVPRFDVRHVLQGRFLMSQPLLLGYVTLPGLRRLFDAIVLEPSYNDAASVTGRLLGRLDAQPPGVPFAALAIYSAAHLPYAAPYPYYRRLPPYRGANRFSQRELPAGQRPSPTEIERVRALYDTALGMFDDELGRIVGYLRRRDLLRHTVIMVMGDHGEELYDDGETLAHGDHLLGQSNRTALVASGPGIAALGAPTRARLRDIDLAPTLAELFAVAPTGGPGASFASLLTAGTVPPERDMYYETGLWLTADPGPSWQRRRLVYPDIATTCQIEGDGRIALRPEFRDIVVSAKHRALETTAGKIVYLPTLYGPEWVLIPPGVRRGESGTPNDGSPMAALAQQLVALTTAMGERWLAGRVLPRADPEPPAAATPYRCTLRIERDAAETEPGRYRGALALSHPVATEPDGAPVAARLDLDVRLAPGQSREWSFATTRPLGTARLALKSEETALTGADLFVGSANLRPFDDLARLDLERLWPAVVDRGGYRAPTAVWLGCRRVAASTP